MCEYSHPDMGKFPDQWIVMVNGKERERVCNMHKRLLYMVPKSRRTVRALPGVTFAPIVDEDEKPFRGKGNLHMDAGTMQQVTAAMASKGQPVVFDRIYSPLGTKYVSKGMTKKVVKSLIE